jgi:hypothetical protein
MDTSHPPANGAPSNPSVTFDKSDLGARGIVMFFIALGVFAIAMHLAALGLWVTLSKVTEKHDAETSPLAKQTVTPRSEVLMNTANVHLEHFPEPRLQNDDTGDMQRFLLKEAAALTSSAQDADGTVHIPIDEAMNTVITRLPARANGTRLVENPGVGRQYSYPTATVETAPATTAGETSEHEQQPAVEAK